MLNGGVDVSDKDFDEDIPNIVNVGYITSEGLCYSP